MGTTTMKINTIQDTLGKDSLFKGIVAKNWTNFQSRYLQQHNLSNNKNQAKYGIKNM